jgi:hypothetical protein
MDAEIDVPKRTRPQLLREFVLLVSSELPQATAGDERAEWTQVKIKNTSAKRMGNKATKLRHSSAACWLKHVRILQLPGPHKRGVLGNLPYEPT